MSQTTWRLLRSGYLPGALNMAIDEALLEAVATGASPPILRLYRWRPATLSLGYGQSVTADLDLEACTRAGIDVVRRTTGGRAVLHDHEVTYAVIARTGTGPFASAVLDCYRVIAEVLQRMLTELGIAARLVPGERRGAQANPTRAVCFSAPSQYELVVDGRKVVGSAQKRQGAAFLQHGSIPLTLDLELLAQILKVAPGDRGSLAKVGWLAEWASRPLTVGGVEDALISAFAAGLGLAWQESAPTAAELARARVLHDEKFGCAAWTNKR